MEFFTGSITGGSPKRSVSDSGPPSVPKHLHTDRSYGVWEFPLVCIDIDAPIHMSCNLILTTMSLKYLPLSASLNPVSLTQVRLRGHSDLTEINNKSYGTGGGIGGYGWKIRRGLQVS